MRKALLFVGLIAMVCEGFAMDARPPPSHPTSEAQEIERLITYVAQLDRAVFIRNGEEHGPADAAAHLRLKREKARKRVLTAEDFIRYCATGSSLSGKPYEIRFADGKVRPAAEVLREYLKTLERGG